MKIVLTNDDGIQADGLEALERSVRQVFAEAEVWVVAPDRPRSQCSHAVTTDQPLGVENHGHRRVSVTGFPADCIRVALFGLGIEPDWVFSGINHGGNMGQDIVFSGTAAAAREAAYHGVPACAVSQFFNSDGFKWDQAADRTAAALSDISSRDRGDAFWNVNLPLPDGGDNSCDLVHCAPARAPLPAEFEKDTNGEEPLFHYRGVYQSRKSEPGTDVDVCFGGGISISRILV